MRFSTARSIAAGRHDTIEVSPTTVDLAAGSSAHSRCGLLGQRGEIAVLGRLVVAPIRRQLDELVDEGRQFLRLAVEVVDQLLTSLRREALETAQHRDVGAQAGQRRAQLVAGVLHELVLLIAAARQRAEHSVERQAQPTGLVGAADRHRDVQPAGGGHIVGGLGQSHQPTRDLPADQPPGDRRRGDDQRDRQQRASTDHVEGALGLAGGAGDLHRAHAFDGNRQHAVRLALDRHVTRLAGPT